jgi:pseudouridine synthase
LAERRERAGTERPAPGRRGRARTLDRLLSRLGLGSRSSAAAWIRAGRVRVDGAVVRDPQRWVDVRARLELDEKRVLATRTLVLALHKPRGVVTTARDPEGRPTIYALLADAPGWVGPVGRLDRDTSGLLLLTNDTELAERITNPAFHLPKTYRVRARPAPDEAALEALRRGVELDDGPTRPAEVSLLRRYRGYGLLELTLREGRNRQVRRMLRAVGSKVDELRRLRIGPVELGDLASGTWRELPPGEVARLRRAVERRARESASRRP